mmetsp:Transcript_10076/g.14541  ORF Transcript_10076/g.14541 Transcript_10076/m.14541 type:complete len:122 (-) Transcript_10076:122-487(-)
MCESELDDFSCSRIQEFCEVYRHIRGIPCCRCVERRVDQKHMLELFEFFCVRLCTSRADTKDISQLVASEKLSCGKPLMRLCEGVSCFCVFSIPKRLESQSDTPNSSSRRFRSSGSVIVSA